MSPDDHFDLSQARRFLSDGIINAVRRISWQQLGHLPLNGFLIALSIGILGENEATARLVPIAWGMLTILVTYVLADSYDGRTSLLASFMLAVSGFHIVFNHLVTTYSLITFVSTLALLLVFRGVSTKSASYAYIVAMLVVSAFYVHFLYAVLLVLTIAVYFVMISAKPIWTSIKDLLLGAGFGQFGMFENRKLKAVVKRAHNPVTYLFSIPCTLAIVLYPILLYRAGSFSPQSSDFLQGTGWHVWDFPRGAYYTGQDPLFYLKHLPFFLSPPVVMLSLLGVGYAFYRRDNLDKLLLVWVILPLTVLTILKTRLPRYALPIVPPLLILSARFVSRAVHFLSQRSSLVAYPATVSILVLASYQPILFEFVANRTVFGPAIWLIDYKMIAEQMDPHVTPADLTLGDYWPAYWYWTNGRYVKGTVSAFSGAVSANNLLSERPRVVVVSIWQKGRIGSGGGPVWLSGKFRSGRIYLTTIELDRLGKYEYIQRMLDETQPKRIAILYLDSQHNWLSNYLDSTSYSYDHYDASLGGIQALFNSVDDYGTVIIGSYVANPDQRGHKVPQLESYSRAIEQYLSQGGSLIVLGIASNEQRNQVIKWLPLRTMIYPKDYSIVRAFRTEDGLDYHYTEEQKSHFSRVWYAGKLVDMPANGFFYAYDEQYQELASTEDFAVLSNNYELIYTLKSLDRPVVWVYKDRSG